MEGDANRNGGKGRVVPSTGSSALRHSDSETTRPGEPRELSGFMSTEGTETDPRHSTELRCVADSAIGIGGRGRPKRKEREELRRLQKGTRTERRRTDDVGVCGLSRVLQEAPSEVLPDREEKEPRILTRHCTLCRRGTRDAALGPRDFAPVNTYPSTPAPRPLHFLLL